MIPKQSLHHVRVFREFADRRDVILVAGDKYEFVDTWAAVFVRILCHVSGNGCVDLFLLTMRALVENKFEAGLSCKMPARFACRRLRTEAVHARELFASNADQKTEQP